MESAQATHETAADFAIVKASPLSLVAWCRRRDCCCSTERGRGRGGGREGEGKKVEKGERGREGEGE
eukprot:COSAG02_NODE_6797_length_3355_cov_2.061732_2_plen_67_part_00